ncbi:hypothetical protein AB1K91_16245 [Terribacillus sp. 179-K 1B1 HS]|uniref:hypothetical protein n=1 Tax=Terribacillus sp. 179-K 1B1 HS TaxID=3142388 RepID=UPI0039A13E44
MKVKRGFIRMGCVVGNIIYAFNAHRFSATNHGSSRSEKSLPAKDNGLLIIGLGFMNFCGVSVSCIVSKQRK